MKREEVREKLKGWGIEEPTEEQISDFLASISKETKSAEDRANHYKADADRVKSLEKELKELTDANLSDVEKANKATEDAMKQVAELQQTVKQMQLTKSLAEIGIIGDDAEGLFDNGELNTAKLGEILTAREKNAVAAYQKEALNSTPSPKGEGGETPPKPENEYAKEYASRVKANTEAQNIVNQYIGG